MLSKKAVANQGLVGMFLWYGVAGSDCAYDCCGDGIGIHLELASSPQGVLSLVWHYYILEASDFGTNLIQNGSNRIFGLGREIEGLVNLIQNQSN